jgi:hypothetical protein
MGKFQMKHFLISLSSLFFLCPSYVYAASGPLAEGFGAQAWLDKLHVVFGVVGVVVILTLTIIFAILKKN